MRSFQGVGFLKTPSMVCEGRDYLYVDHPGGQDIVLSGPVTLWFDSDRSRVRDAAGETISFPIHCYTLLDDIEQQRVDAYPGGGVDKLWYLVTPYD